MSDKGDAEDQPHPDAPSEAGGEVQPAEDLPPGIAQVAWDAADEIDRAHGVPPNPLFETDDEPEEDLPEGQAVLHGTCVAVADRAVLLLGASGSGKSSIALELIAHGAELVADDRVYLSAEGARLLARAKAGFEGLIEARGIGILRVPHVAEAEVSVVVDLNRPNFSDCRKVARHEILGLTVHLVKGRENRALVPALLALLKGGMWEDA